MKKSFAPILVIAFAIAVVCTAIFYGLVAGKLATGAKANSTPMVLVASRDIARGSSVGALDVKSVPWSGGQVPGGAFRSPAQVDGLTAVADIAQGEPLVDTRLGSKRGGAGLGIPSGMRAISVQVHDSSGVVAMLKSGHRVDVQAVYTRTGSTQDAELRTVLENIEVLKIALAVEPAPGRPAMPVATLLVTPSEADVAGLADAVARVRLVLRNPFDQERVSRSTVAIAGLMHGATSAVRQAPSAAYYVRPAPVAAPSPLSLAPAPAAAPACTPPVASK